MKLNIFSLLKYIRQCIFLIIKLKLGSEDVLNIFIVKKIEKKLIYEYKSMKFRLIKIIKF